MKNIYVLVSAAIMSMAFAACTSDALIDEEVKEPATAEQVDGESVVFRSVIEGDLEILEEEGEGPSTRATISEGQLTGWTAGDVVSISDGMLAYSYQVSSTDGTSCVFDVIDEGSSFVGDTESTFYAFYPEKAISGAGTRGGWNGTTVSAMVFAGQDYTENLDNGGLFGAYMVSDGAQVANGTAHFTFKLIASVVEVNLSGISNIESVSLKAKGGEAIAGVMKYDCANSSYSLASKDKTNTAASTQSDVITVGGTIPDGATVRFYLLPVQLTQGVVITVKTTDGTYYTKTSAASVGSGNPYYKKYNFGATSTAKTNNWMATIPSNTRLNMLTIPGAHNAASKSVSGVQAEYSKCQELSIADLYTAGVRAFDIRPAYKYSSEPGSVEDLVIYHGTSSCNVNFTDAMTTLLNSVANSTEAVIIVLNGAEGSSLLTTDYTTQWRSLIKDYLAGLAGESKIVSSLTADMTLNDVRGKLVVLTRKPYGDGGSFSPCYGGFLGLYEDSWQWPDNQTFEGYVYKENLGVVTDLSVQDQYNVETSDKKTYVENLIKNAVVDNSTRWYINFTSMVKTLTYPKDYAEEVNPAVVSMLPNYTGRLGIMMSDFIGGSSYSGSALCKGFMAQNGKYVLNGRSRIALTETPGYDVEIDEDDYATGGEVLANSRR